MKLTKELFKGYKLNKDKLLPYGFTKDNNKYIKTIGIKDNSFTLSVVIDNNILTAKLYDNDFNEEYTLIDSINDGSFLTSLRDECSKALKDIRDNCYIELVHQSNQANRIDKALNKLYNSLPEALWEKYPGYKVYRNNKTKKWITIIMDVEESKIYGSDKKIIDIIDINLGDEALDYINNRDIFQAYHMNKKKWVTIILDDTHPDDFILKLIDKSFALSNK
ncbi:MAG: MmcQ/YjbR family DNA-binding protein [Acholeplasmatales bacterium]|nr:MmcQ/YjbR family DNA-binding protein [Acholeplasmatales bacterium]